ncbi:Stk1 family PASTA domain-containing Ser/Thr kinase [Niameybacter massiliensis]|uniref:Stk1 family PASTA domain-containing Ser/Thr kinase n=1 Tax=Niameybacter massiliensis TaxID=1658108 RepID=UPI0006B5A440|nr:Stk1 family PASTA domain-containing Ser/Thr kinase [Niameybacter massiliensis]
MLEPGTLLGERYEIIEKIGAGGMSIVYRAKCNRLQRFVAIKVLREEFVKDEDFVKKFKSEAFAAASLSHPNIVGIYDVGQEEDLHYIVMEYVEGETLKEYIEKNGPLASEVVLDFGNQIVSAIRHAHSKHIIHRDIKPQNILITHECVLKVADFGIARAVDSSTIVSTGNAIGSVHYFSPEQAKGRYVNETSDLYSCGIVMFEMATKQLPFEADSHVSIALKHINEEIPQPSLFNKEIWPGLESIILRATKKQQEERYQNADSMLEDIRKVQINPQAIIETKVMDDSIDQTILLTDVQTQFIRQNEKTTNKLDSSQVSAVKMTSPQDLYQDDDEEEDEEVPKGYKVLAGIGGVLATLVIVGIVAAIAFFALPSFSKPDAVVVPGVLGKTIEEATKIFESKDLKVKKVGEEASNLYEPGTIMKQTPGAEEVVKPGSTIEVIVASAEEEVKEVIVPDLKDLRAADAQRELEKYKLEFFPERRYDDKVEMNQVIEQSPGAGERVEEGTVITVVISKGPKQVLVKVPNLENMTVNEAKLALNNVGLRLGQTNTQPSDTVEKGKIITQSIPASSELEEGEIVDIMVSEGPKVEEPEEVPEEPNPPAIEDPNLPTDDETGNNDQGQEPSEKLATITKVINAPDQAKDEYHVVLLLEDELGARSVFDQVVKKEQFPLPVQITGKGKGVLTTYFDGSEEYKDNINFNEVTQ